VQEPAKKLNLAIVCGSLFCMGVKRGR